MFTFRSERGVLGEQSSLQSTTPISVKRKLSEKGALETGFFRTGVHPDSTFIIIGLRDFVTPHGSAGDADPRQIIFPPFGLMATHIWYVGYFQLSIASLSVCHRAQFTSQSVHHTA